MGDEDIKLSCAICMERYSDIRFPIVSPYCGHSICKDCGNNRKSNICVTCNVGNFPGSYNTHPCRSDAWQKNFALLEVINIYEEKKKKDDASKNIDYLECSSCKKMEERGRMKICVTCAEGFDKEWEGKEENEISSFILCSHCIHEEHDGHSFTKYLPWKLAHFLTSTVSNGKAAVFSMDEICIYEIEKGKEQLGKWNEEMDSFRSMKCETYPNGLSIGNTLQREADLVTGVSEECVRPLRMFRKVVTDSITRLQHLHQDVDDGKTVSDPKLEEKVQQPSETEIMRGEYEEKIRKLNETISQLKQGKDTRKQVRFVRGVVAYRYDPTSKLMENTEVEAVGGVKRTGQGFEDVKKRRSSTGSAVQNNSAGHVMTARNSQGPNVANAYASQAAPEAVNAVSGANVMQMADTEKQTDDPTPTKKRKRLGH